MNAESMKRYTLEVFASMTIVIRTVLISMYKTSQALDSTITKSNF